eukprot:g612.t1
MVLAIGWVSCKRRTPTAPDSNERAPAADTAAAEGTSSSRAAPADDGTPPASAAKEARRCRKKLRSLEDLAAKRGAGAALDADQVAKLTALQASEPRLRAELRAAEAQIAALETESRAAVQRQQEQDAARKAALQDTLKVEFDSQFACSICCEVLEAATAVEGCRHVFCRACLEDVAARATVPAHCVCPLCRASLFDGERMRLRPARELRRRMAKRTGRCHCGKEVPLSQLRAHLRACGLAGAHYMEKPKFKHSYRKPSFDADRVRGFATDADMAAAVSMSLASYFDEVQMRGSGSDA